MYIKKEESYLSTIKENGLERIFANSSSLSILNNIRKELVYSKKASNRTYNVLCDLSKLLNEEKINPEHMLAYYTKSSGDSVKIIATHLYINFVNFFPDKNNKNEIKSIFIKICKKEKVENEKTQKFIKFIEEFMFFLHRN